MIANQTSRKPRPAATDAKRARYVNLTAVRWAQEQTPGATLSSTLIAVAGFANKAGQCWPSQAAIAALTSQTDRTVRTKMRKLEALGYFTVTYRYDREGKRTSSLIQMNWNIRNPEATTGKNEADYRKTCSDKEEGINNRKTDQVCDDEARSEPSNPSPDQPKERQARRVEVVDRSCHEPAPPPPREPKAHEFLNAYPSHDTHTAADRREAVVAFVNAVNRGVEPDLMIWGAHNYRHMTQRKGIRSQAPQWWLRKQLWNDHAGVEQFVAAAGDTRERKRLMAVAEYAGHFR